MGIDRLLETRRRKLERLLLPRGTAPKIAEAIGVSPAYLWQMARGHGKSSRPINDEKARAIERAAGVNDGWLDEEDEQAGREIQRAIYADEALRGRELVFIAKVKGATIDPKYGPQVVEWLTVEDSHVFRADYIADRELDPESCCVYPLPDEAMEPRLRKGGIVLIDCRDRKPSHGHIYALIDAEGLKVRQLRRSRDGGWSIHCLNPDQDTFPPEPMIEEQWRVSGRIVWYATDID